MAGQSAYDANLDKALALHAAGHLSEAESIYRQILNEFPDDLDALNLLGLVLQDQGDHAQSIAVLTHVLEIEPAFPEALANLARVQLAVGQPKVALEHACSAIAIDADLPEAHLQRGRALIDLQDFAASEKALCQVLQLNPDLADAHLFLGITFARQGRPDDAIEAFESVLRLQPGHPAGLIAAGTALAGIGRLDEALAYHQQAVALVPDDAAAHAALAVTYRRRLDPAASAEFARNAAELAPDRSDVWLLLGANLASLGDFEQAASCQRKALALSPGSAEARRDLALIGQPADDASATDYLKAVLANAEAPDTDRVAAGFGLGTILDRSRDFDGAFAAYQAANRLLHDRHAREGRAFNLTQLRKTVDWVITTFDAAFLADLAGKGDPSDRPVFVVGMARSGTSLVEQIAASHPDVFGVGERKDIGGILQRLDGGPANRSPAQWNPEAIRTEANDYIVKMTALSRNSARFVDKLPDNIFMLGLIAVLFPGARVIICQRDPRDNCLSAYFQQFGDDVTWSYDLNDCAEWALELQRLTGHWRDTLPLPLLEMRYEDLVADLEGQSRRLIAFLDLPWDPGCLDFHRTDRAIMSASYWQVRQPIYSTSVGKWRHYRRHLTPLLLALTGSFVDVSAEDGSDLVADARLAVQAARHHQDLGRPAAAETIYTMILRSHPADLEALSGLGLVKLQRGDTATALEMLTAAAEADPSSAKGQANLALALLESGKPQEALTVARLATERHPDSLDAWIQLGNVSARLANWKEASVALRRGAKLAPGAVTVMVGLGKALMELGDFDEARAAWQQALDLDPDNLEALIGMGAALTELSLWDDSQIFVEAVIARKPRDSGVLYRIAWVFFRQQMLLKGIEFAEAGLRLAPEAMDLLLLLGEMHGLLGDFDAASETYRRVLALDPESGLALSGLMTIGQGIDRDVLIAKALRRVGDTTAAAVDRSAAAFAVADSYDKLGNYDAAFHHYQLGNQLVRQRRTEPDATRQLDLLQEVLDSSIEVFNDETFVKTIPLANMSNLPVFIAGMPRSGTTLVEQIAASHPLVFGLGERFDIPDLLGAVKERKVLESPIVWDPSEYHRKTAALVQKLQSYDPTAQRVINKLPDNILWLGQIAILFPRAQIIICRRDLRDVCWSAYKQNFAAPGMIWTDTLEECALRARKIDAMIDHWLSVLPVPVLEVQYETLVADLEGESRRLIDFLGLPWDPACLSFHKTDRQILTASVWQVRQPLYASSVGRWRPYRQHLGPLLEGLEGLVPEDA
jgi:tetratricopeptide (TPR) repeat protein